MSAIDRRLITHANWSLIGFTLLLFSVGVVNLYSAGGVRIEDGIQVAPYFQRQLLWGGLGVCGMAVCTLFDYRHLKNLALPAFVCAIVILTAVLLVGTTAKGATRWIDLKFTRLQPSELAKISSLLMGAALLSRYKGSLGWRQFFFVLGIAVVTPCTLIFLQPDLGTAILILLLVGGVILYKGVKPHVFIVSALTVLLMMPAGWFVLKDYQKERIMMFMDPTRDPQGAGYHIIQSQIAIGSGEFWGKGFQQGTQSLLRFLPEKHTDFAVAVLSEEWGFLGCVVLLALFCCFLLCIINTAREAKDSFGSLLCAGVFFYFFWQILINIGMVVGLMPVVGVPLPFISYGGTATIVNFLMLGLVLNVSMRRFMFKSS